MTEELQEKVINIFRRARRGEHVHIPGEEDGEMVDSPDGFSYVTLKQNQDGDHHDEDELVETAARKHYLVKMLEHHKDAIRINNYHVPGDRLEEFMSTLESRPGKVLEIKQFLPDITG
ncbi:MAG: hypothetical protein KTR14_03430 [Vampirovibrio sp.]|nr:hypothetical protein [Vampirovibrio sp.]